MMCEFGYVVAMTGLLQHLLLSRGLRRTTISWPPWDG